jgi:ketosteroid isomerase-like protein
MKAMKSSILLLMFACCIACTTNTGDNNDEKMIVDKRMAFNLAIADHDISKMEEYCDQDIIVITSRNSKFLGKDQYAAGLNQEFKLKYDVAYTRTPESIKVFPTWEMAAESGSWVGKWKNGNEAIEIKGTYYAKWKKKNGQWFITAEVFTPLNCTGNSYCTDPPQ